MALKSKATKNNLQYAPSSFDVIGNKDKAVAIIEISEELLKKKKTSIDARPRRQDAQTPKPLDAEGVMQRASYSRVVKQLGVIRLVAEAVMKRHKNVMSVLLKSSPRFGTYRTRKLKLIAGSRNTEVVHVEHGLRFLLNPRKAYFSPREGTERIRICEMIKPDEVVMVFFAGIGPFAIAIAKKTKAKRVIGIEINPDAVNYFRKSAVLNKARNIEIVEGDVKEACSRFHGMCDRVLMPLPESSIDFVKEAVSCLKPLGIIHFYCFIKEDDISRIKDKIKSIAHVIGKKIDFIGEQKVLPYGPRIWKYRIDFRAN